MLNKLGAYRNPDVGFLLVRIAVGVVFIAHGWQKLQGMEGVISFFGQLGLPTFVAYMVMLVEILGGLAILLGVFVPYAGLMVATVMIFAIALVKLQNGLLGGGGKSGYELEMTLLLAAVSLFLTGAGRYTVSSLFKKKGQSVSPQMM